MRLRLFFLVLPALALVAPSARAQVFAGPNLEWSHWSYSAPFADESGSALAAGGGYLTPGLRLGYLFTGAAFAAFVDAGIQTQHHASVTYTSVLVEPTIAYAIQSERPTSPYLALSYGLDHQSQGGPEKFTRPVVGGAVGVRHRVSSGHGFVRAELRYAHFVEEDTKGLIVPVDIVGIRVGCDLLLSR